jgi:hypothetical protein
MAPPGNYQVKLSADGKSLTVPLELKMDPRVRVSAADMAKEFELELKIRDTLSSIHETIQEIRETRVQLRGLGTRLQDPRFKSVFEAAESLDKKMTPIEEQLLQVNAKSSEANLNYPNMPDEQLHYLVFSVEVDDGFFAMDRCPRRSFKVKGWGTAAALGMAGFAIMVTPLMTGVRARLPSLTHCPNKLARTGGRCRTRTTNLDDSARNSIRRCGGAHIR